VPETSIKIPINEGESKRADRNHTVFMLEIPAAEIRRDVPAGSDVEITIDINASRLVHVNVYIPILDQEFEGILDYSEYRKKARTPEHLREEAAAEKARLAGARDRAQRTADPAALKVLERILAEQIEQDLDSLLDAAQADPDAAQKCEKRLNDLKMAIDDLEDALEWPLLAAEAEELAKDTYNVVVRYGSAADKRAQADLEQEAHQAIERRDPDILRRKMEELAALRFRTLTPQAWFWVTLLQEIEGMRGRVLDLAQAEQLRARGRRAIERNDVAALKAAVSQLIPLLPPDDQQRMRKTISGVS
jgi:molecular chaperone DnaK